jgi:hypothetical protein
MDSDRRNRCALSRPVIQIVNPGGDRRRIVMGTLQRIRQKFIDREYYLSPHAEDEMLDDELERIDIENT